MLDLCSGSTVEWFPVCSIKWYNKWLWIQFCNYLAWQMQRNRNNCYFGKNSNNYTNNSTNNYTTVLQTFNFQCKLQKRNIGYKSMFVTIVCISFYLFSWHIKRPALHCYYTRDSWLSKLNKKCHLWVKHFYLSLLVNFDQNSCPNKYTWLYCTVFFGQNCSRHYRRGFVSIFLS